MTIEYKLFDAPDVRLADEETAGEITGYASTFANFDDVGERVVKGAFTRHLGAFLKDGFIAVGHNWSALPIAMPVAAQEDDHGLLVRGAFHSTDDAQRARTVMRERLANGKSVKLSIGYEVLADEYTEEGRLLKDVRLFEWSYVTVPANQLASVTGVKGLQLGGGPLSAFADALEGAMTAYVKEARALHERRAKAGRVFSEANLSTMDVAMQTIEQGLKTLRELRSRAEPKVAAPDDQAEAVKLLAEFQRTQLFLNGVLHA
jgi:HK97 family phage prohead protease